MQLTDTDKAYLWDISKACEDIISFSKGISLDQLALDNMRRYAIERQLIVIGEAANHLSDEFINKTSEIPWNNIIGLRNILAHDYGEVLIERIWYTVENHIAELYKNVNEFLDL